MIDQMIYSVLTDPDGTLAPYIYENVPIIWRLYPRGALGTDNIPSQPTFPYVMLGENTGTQERSVRDTAFTRYLNFDFYVYDTPGSFIRIKTIHEVIRQLLAPLTGTVAGDGTRCTDVLLVTTSADSYDTINKQNVKSASYRFVVSK